MTTTTPEYIYTEPHCHDAWRCPCGNRPDLEGFFPCTDAGLYCEPTIWGGWTVHYRCDRCGRIIDGFTRQVTGRYEVQS